MKEQTSAVHYAIALLLGVIGLLIILIFVSLRSQAEFLTTTDDENQEVTQEVPALDQDQNTPEILIEYTDGEGNVIEEGYEEDNSGEASTSTEEVLDLEEDSATGDDTISTSNTENTDLEVVEDK